MICVNKSNPQLLLRPQQHKKLITSQPGVYTTEKWESDKNRNKTQRLSHAAKRLENKKAPDYSGVFKWSAEREGFEPNPETRYCQYFYRSGKGESPNFPLVKSCRILYKFNQFALLVMT
jgi:hypothetical protein